jgi:ribosome biogenesis GTPase
LSGARSQSANAGPTLAGTVSASFGRTCLVEIDGAEVIRCVSRGKRTGIVCGDRVAITRVAAGQGIVERIEARSTLFYRSDAWRQKLIAANVTQVIVVLAAVPGFHEDLLNRCLLAAEHAGVRTLIVLNKADLAEAAAAAAQRLALYANLGYRVLQLAAKQTAQPLLPYLRDHVSVMVGQSGMGKSTIINALLPDAAVRTADISTALDSGRHTTTSAHLYHIDVCSHLIDSPGMQEFGLHHLSAADAAHGFVEFRPLLGACKFNDCTHVHEPGCAIVAAVVDGRVQERRLAAFRRIAAELGPSVRTSSR